MDGIGFLHMFLGCDILACDFFKCDLLVCGFHVKGRKDDQRHQQYEDLAWTFAKSSPLNIIKFDGTLIYKRKGSFLPSPSDTSVTLTGSGWIAKESWMQLISSSEWEIVNTKEIPGELAKVLPPGNYKTNRKMNNDFSSIPPLKHLFFVISCAEEKFFVIATDFEHPLSIPGYGLEAKDSSPKRIDVDF